MTKLITGLLFVAAITTAFAAGQHDKNRGGGGHATAQSHTRTMTHTTTRSSGHSMTQTHTRTVTHTASHSRSGGHTGRRAGGTNWNGTGHVHYAGGRGVGHARDWFEGRRWHEGPAWVTPIHSCYPGFAFSAIPANHVVVWIFDSATGQYYEAYYYPEWGYYAWVSNPLVAVGEYSPQISMVVNL